METFTTKTFNCNNCGAGHKRNDNKCSYCGSHFKIDRINLDLSEDSYEIAREGRHPLCGIFC